MALPLEHWNHVSLAVVFDVWRQAGFGMRRVPWEEPPPGFEQGALILTAPYRIYRLDSYRELYRLMIRDGFLKLVHENGAEEKVVEAYIRGTPRVASVAPTVEGSNVIPFKPKPRILR